MSLFSCTIL